VPNDTTLLLGLDGVEVQSVTLQADGCPLVLLATVDERARSCPECGVQATRVKEWTTTRPRDIAPAEYLVRAGQEHIQDWCGGDRPSLEPRAVVLVKSRA